MRSSLTPRGTSHHLLIKGIYLVPRKIIFLFAAVTTLSGCFQHYCSTQTQTHVDETSVKSLVSQNKYFVIHSQDRIQGLESLSVSTDKLEGNIVPLPPEHSKYTNVQEHSTKNVVRRRDEKTTLSEVHLYTNAKIDSEAKQLSIPFSSVNQIDVYKFNADATRANRALSWVGIVLGTAFAALITAMFASGAYYE